MSHPFGGRGGRHYLHDVPMADALERWDAAMEAAEVQLPLAAEQVSVAEALGRVTAGPVWARRSSPPFDAAAMDGVAVRAASTVGASETTPLRLALGDQAIAATSTARSRSPSGSSSSMAVTSSPIERTCW